MSSLCTDGRYEMGSTVVKAGTHDQTRRIRGREGGRRVHRRDHAKGKTWATRPETRNETYICLKVRVGKCLLDRYPFLWVKCLHDK